MKNLIYHFPTCYAYSVKKPIGNYRILSKNSSLTLSRKIRHLVANRVGMNKLAEGDEYLDYFDETLERTAKPWSTLLGAFLETKWRVLNSPYGQQFEGITFTKTPGRRQSGKNSSATKNGPMDTTGTPSSCLANN